MTLFVIYDCNPLRVLHSVTADKTTRGVTDMTNQ